MGDPIRALTSIGLSETKAKETLKNEAVSRNILSAVASARAELNLNDDSPFEKTIGNLLYHIGTKIKPRIADRIPLLSQYVTKGWIDSEARLNAALAFLTDHLGPDLDLKAFDEAIGKGIVVTSEDIEKKIAKLIAGNKEQLVSERYSFNFGKLLGSARDELKWGDGKEIKNELDVQILELLGPKTAEELSGKKKPAKEKNSNESNKNDNKKQEVKKNKVEVNGEVDGDASKDTSQTVAELMKSPAMAALHAPGKNHTTDGYQVTPKTAELLAAHLKRTGGQVRTRFPPEPNGVLHIGHAKAIHVNFGYAAANNGICFLRYDDTNPEKEEEKFFVAIKEMVEWLGYKPYKITHSSDYFEELYQMAETLIEKGLAYVCHQKQEEIKGFDPPPSPWRNRDVEENLKLFRAMRDGAFDEGEAVLRLKHILEEGKQDPVAYRIKYVPHHRTGDVWCIYPTYDYTHCLCDSLEDITHSLCTKEFQSRRSSYYWLCNVLEVYCPVQWEYARLNVHRTVVSKRKIAALITNQMVHDWDDPRLFTLTALRRRGVPPAAINNFVARLGLSGAQMAVGPEYLDACVRDTLNVTAPRTMVVLDPLKLVITNLQVPRKSVDVPDFPSVTPSASGDSKGKTHSVLLTPVLFIERSDFRDGEKVDKDYRRLTINQAVGLRHAGLVVSVERVVRNPDGHVVELFVKCTPAEEAEKKPKAFIHWVSEPKTVEVRLYEHLFVHQHPEDPEEVPGGFLSDINPNSLTIIKEALCDEYLVRSKPSVHSAFQFERHGFFAIDPDSDFDAGKLVFNRTVSLKEDTGKNK